MALGEHGQKEAGKAENKRLLAKIMRIMGVWLSEKTAKSNVAVKAAGAALATKDGGGEVII